MTTSTIEIDIVDDDSATGTLKYLVAETNREPFVAQDIHELLEEVGDFDSTDVYLLMPDMTPVPVTVRVNLHSANDFTVRLGFEPTYGELIEHVDYVNWQRGTNDTTLHTQYVNGWPDPVN